MKCPVCKEPDLVMTDRQNIEIDYCPQCRGVWLDRGELDKMIERAAASVAVPEAMSARPTPPDPSYSDHSSGRQDDRYRHGYPHKKRKGFLSDLFDFD